MLLKKNDAFNLFWISTITNMMSVIPPPPLKYKEKELQCFQRKTAATEKYSTCVPLEEGNNWIWEVVLTNGDSAVTCDSPEQDLLETFLSF